MVHGTYNEVINDPNSPATPYENSKTKKEVYEHDLKKYIKIKEYTDNIYIFWESKNIFEKFI